ncbi:MAG: hypothetical protein EB059_08565 [Alphaproteobacteria bacterium]|nr:hypothetical protein [Alphaproteobacteria bacterium]
MVKQEIHNLWNSIQQAYAPDAQMINDIDEFLGAHEWQLALEHMEDVIGPDIPASLVAAIAHIRAQMQD